MPIQQRVVTIILSNQHPEEVYLPKSKEFTQTEVDLFRERFFARFHLIQDIDFKTIENEKETDFDFHKFYWKKK